MNLAEKIDTKVPCKHVPNEVSLVWMDFNEKRKDRSLLSSFQDICRVESLSFREIQSGSSGKAGVDCLCFELDYPDFDSLRAINLIKYDWPDIPTILFTVEHSEELLLWSLRNHLWDLHFKPVSQHQVEAIYHNMQTARCTEDRENLHRLSIPLHYGVGCPKTLEQSNQSHNQRVVNLALNYIEMNCHEKISASVVARECAVTYFQFRRVFQKEFNQTFQEYLLEYRIGRAKQLLQKADANIASVSYSVGFRDPSYFTRVFRRVTSESPSAYRAHFK